MLTLKGIYENGKVTLEKNLRLNKKVKVLVTFIGEETDNREAEHKKTKKLPDTFYEPVKVDAYKIFDRDEIYRNG